MRFCRKMKQPDHHHHHHHHFLLRITMITPLLIVLFLLIKLLLLLSTLPPPPPHLSTFSTITFPPLLLHILNFPCPPPLSLPLSHPSTATTPSSTPLLHQVNTSCPPLWAPTSTHSSPHRPCPHGEGVKWTWRGVRIPLHVHTFSNQVWRSMCT